MSDQPRKAGDSRTSPPSSIIPPGLQGGRLNMPRCRGCGTSVANHGEVCEVCADKPQFQAPKGMIETGAQPEPPYHREGNFRRQP